MTATSPRVVAFGDLLLRLNPPGYERLVQASVFEARYTGAEANVAAILSSLGVTASVVSKVPDDEIGQACINYLRRFGIDTRHVARGGPRLGLFYLEAGAAQRPSKVIYDRVGSSFAQLSGRDFDWDRILSGASWFHFSGTAPALGEGVVLALEEGLIRAKSLGLTVSCDLNYRARLWSPDEARAVLSRLMEYVDVLIGNEEDAVTVFGLDAAGIDVKQGGLSSRHIEMLRHSWCSDSPLSMSPQRCVGVFPLRSIIGAVWRTTASHTTLVARMKSLP